MEHFTWNNKYSVANAELDHHHKNLFAIFNKLYDSCLKKNDAPLGAIIDELASYSTYHFHAEEQYMEEIGYNGIEQHSAEHRTFAVRIAKYRHAHEASDEVVSKEIVLHLWKWLIDHVMTEDKKYSIKPKRPAQRTTHDRQN